MPRRASFAVLPALALLAGACFGGDADGEPAAEGTMTSTAPVTTAPARTAPLASPAAAASPASQPARPAAPRVVVPEHELVGISGWINSEPLTIAELASAGRVVLIDFWTYTCVNCIRTLPFLREWHEKYEDRGLTIIGVHAPEFEFEQVRANVLAAVEQYGIEYPVAQDNEMATWREFDNNVWPAKYVIGVDGTLRHKQFGEGGYQLMEQVIRRALEDAGQDVSDIALGDVDFQARDPLASSLTRELYGGYRWNYSSFGPFAAQLEYYDGPDRELLYEDVQAHRENRWYLHGLWRNEREAIVHARETAAFEDYIALRFSARSANVVLRLQGGEPFEMRVELDGIPLTPEQAGVDVSFDAAGNSIVIVDEPRLYAIVELPVFGEHELTLRANSDDFAVFAFTFGIYEEGP